MPSAAESLLERMRKSKHGWGCDDLHTLYLGFGFGCREGGKHRVYIHVEYPELRATVARHSDLPAAYVRHAINLIERLAALKVGKREGRSR
jgi:hypothetical protein